jgi:hypothetical protein
VGDADGGENSAGNVTSSAQVSREEEMWSKDAERCVYETRRSLRQSVRGFKDVNVATPARTIAN